MFVFVDGSVFRDVTRAMYRDYPNLNPNQVYLIKLNTLHDDGSGIIFRIFRLTIGDGGWKQKLLVDLKF